MCGLTMAGSSPTSREPRVRAVWPQELRRAAVLLSAGSLLYWLAFAFGGWTLWIDGVGILYMDLLLAWVGVLLNVLAWPDLWDGLRDLVVDHPTETDALVARRSFFMTLALVAGAVVFLPLQYHVVSANQAWILLLYISAFPFLAWIFIPTLALHGILFGRAANFLDGPSRRLAEAGVIVLFAVAAATSAVVLANPDATVFVRSWSVGSGILPAAACLGYLLVAGSLTLHSLPEPKPAPTRGWALAKTPRGGPERFA